jgi:hypothetical protein
MKSPFPGMDPYLEPHWLDIHARLYPAPLRARLPDVPVPLRPEDPSVVLPLQRLVEEAYAKGRYALTLDYTAPCDPPLESEDAAWAEDLLWRAGKRS